MKKTDISLDALTPYIRKAGLQNTISWKDSSRRIYDHQWMFFTEGRGHYKANDTTYDLVPGTLLLIEPGIPHYCWIDEDMPSVIKWVHFDIEYRKDVYDLDALLRRGQGHLYDGEAQDESYLRKSYTFNGHIELPNTYTFKDIETINGYFNNILSAYSQHKVSWQLAARANWLKIMERLVDQLTDGHKTANPSDPNTLVKDICLYIGNNYHNKLTRQTLANYYGYNPDYMGKLFKSEMNKSISAYINELRIEKAKNLLIQTDLSVQNISELVGFKDVFYFSKKMKTVTGLSPSQWR